MEPSSTPWRVFDAPAAGEAAGPVKPGAAPAAPRAASRPVAIAALLGSVAVGALALVVALSSSGSEVADGPMAAGTSEPAASGAPTGEILVDVSGAVAAPGIYHLATGSRVGDAIEAAGGFSPRVNVERVGAELNLAAPLTDGAQVHVPSRDDANVAAGTAGPADGRLVNINTATEAELDALSGIGPVTAGKIIESRTSAPFKSVDELRERGLLGQKAFDKIKAQLTAG